MGTRIATLSGVRSSSRRNRRRPFVLLSLVLWLPSCGPSEPEIVFERPRKTPERLLISPTGGTVVSYASRTRVWRRDQGEWTVRLRLPRISAAAFSCDGRRMVLAVPQRGVGIWTADTLEALGWVPTRNLITDVALDRSGNVLAMLAPSEVRIYRDGELLWSEPYGEDHVSALSLSRDGKYLATGGHPVLRVRNIEDREEALRVPYEVLRAVHSIDISPDNALVVVGTSQHWMDERDPVDLWSLPRQELVGQFDSDCAGLVRSIRFSRDGLTLVGAGACYRLLRWSLRPTGTPDREGCCHYGIDTVVPHVSDQYVFTMGWDNKIWKWPL